MPFMLLTLSVCGLRNGTRAFSLVHAFRNLRTRTWPCKVSSLVTRDVAIVLASCLLAAVIVYRLPSPNAEAHVRSSTFGILGPVGAVLRLVLFPIDLVITLFWRVLKSLLEALLGIPVIGDVVRLFFRILSFPFEAFRLRGNIFKPSPVSECESLSAAITDLEEVVQRLEDAHRTRQ